MSAVRLFSSTSRGSVGLASVVGPPDDTCFFGLVGQLQPGLAGPTFAIRAASPAVNTCFRSSPPLQPPTTTAATTAIAPRIMATVTIRDPRTGLARVPSPECVGGHSRTLAQPRALTFANIERRENPRHP